MVAKTENFHKTRCTEHEKRAVDLAAQGEGISVSDALRFLVREGAKLHGYWADALGLDPERFKHYACALTDAREKYVTGRCARGQEREAEDAH